MAGTTQSVGTTQSYSGTWLALLSQRIDVIAQGGTLIQSFTYDDTGAGWPSITDGGGPSLTPIYMNPSLYNLPSNWRASFVMDGTPGIEENDAPTGAHLSFHQVNENETDRLVGVLTTDDPDLFEVFEYSIQPGGLSSYFVIVGDQVRVGNIPLNYESTPSGYIDILSTDSGGASVLQRFTIEIIDQNDAPVANAGGPYIGWEGVPFELHGSAFDEDAGQELTYEWDLDYDGVTFNVDATGSMPTLVFPDQLAARTIAMRVRDSGSPQLSDIAITTLSIENVPPQLTVQSSSVSGLIGQPLVNSGTWFDVPSDTVSLNVSLGTINKLADGSWTWSYTPITTMSNQSVTITAMDEDGGESQLSFSINVIAVAPTVGKLVFGAGSQRSMIRSITVDFNSVVDIEPNAFLLERSDAFAAFNPNAFVPYSQATIHVATSTFNNGTQTRATLTFGSTSTTDPLRIIGGSLADGNYRLTLNAAAITRHGVMLDGDGDGTPGGNLVRGNTRSDGYFRIFSDFNGDGVIDGKDSNACKNTFGRSQGQLFFDSAFDYDWNGTINELDANQFRARYGKVRR